MLFEELLMQKLKLNDLNSEINDLVLTNEFTIELNSIRDAAIDEEDHHQCKARDNRHINKRQLNFIKKNSTTLSES